MKKINKTLSNNYYLLITIYCLLNTFNSYSQGAGSALNFNGGTNQVNCGDPVSNVFDLTGNATLEAWIKTTVTPPARLGGTGFTIVGKDVGAGGNIDKWFFALQNGGLAFHINGTSSPFTGQWIYSTSSFTFNLNESYYAVCVKNGNNISFYINGISIGGGTLSQAITDFPSSLKIAFSEPCCTFNGTIDEVRIWNRALTQTEIQENMCKKLTGTEVGLVAYYPMNEGIDNTCSGGEDVCDMSGNGNNGIKF